MSFVLGTEPGEKEDGYGDERNVKVVQRGELAGEKRPLLSRARILQSFPGENGTVAAIFPKIMQAHSFHLSVASRGFADFPRIEMLICTSGYAERL